MVTVSGDWAEFRFYRPQASRVYLAGDFNGWNAQQLPMVRNSEGYWFARLRLPQGEFKFRYCADGQWFADYAAFGVEHGSFGLNSIVRIAPFVQPILNPTANDPIQTAAA